MKINGRTVALHRYVYEQAHGPIAEGLIVHHVNGDPLDNRVENLRAMTPAEHARLHNDRHPRERTCDVCGETYAPAATKRSRSRTCSRPCFRELMARPRPEKRALTDEQVAEARRRVAAGERSGDVARSFGVSPQLISRVAPRAELVL